MRFLPPACTGFLQVRLEIAVIPNLFVNLQTIPLAIGDNQRVAIRIELDRGREAQPPLRFEALHPAARFGHVRVGIDALLTPLRQYLGIADQRRDRSTLGVENAHPMVAPVANVDIAICVDGDIGWMIELVGAGITSLLAVGLNIW